MGDFLSDVVDLQKLNLKVKLRVTFGLFTRVRGADGKGVRVRRKIMTQRLPMCNCPPLCLQWCQTLACVNFIPSRKRSVCGDSVCVVSISVDHIMALWWMNVTARNGGGIFRVDVWAGA